MVFISVSNALAEVPRETVLSSRYAFNSFFFFFSNKDCRDNYVTRFLHRRA